MLVGTTLRNRYAITEVLGSGGFGDTYLAVDRDLPGSPKCVVKQLKPKDTSPGVLPVAKNLFEREAEYLYKLGNAHPQIPDLFAHFEEGGGFYLVEEFVDGHNLSVEIQAGIKLPEYEVTNLLLEILDVLAFVHQNNVIHRDIKLQNLMRRNRDRRIVLIDFGAVKDVSILGVDSQGQTNVTVSIGSPGYMPSEQAKGKPRLSSDVYAVGMIGIQALTGLQPEQLPEDPNTGEIVWRDRAQVSDALADVLQTMVHYHFSQRYKSAIEALQALKAIATPIANTPATHSDPTVVSSGTNPAIASPARPTTPGSASSAPATIISSTSPQNEPPANYQPNPLPHSQQNTVPVTPQSFYPPNPQPSTSQPSSQSSPSNPSVILGALIGAGVVVLGVIGLFVVPKLLPNSGQSVQTTNRNENSDSQKNPVNIDTSPTPEVSSTPEPTTEANAGNDSSKKFQQVQITSFDTFKHSSGLFELAIPTGWTPTDTSKPGEVIVVWFDPTQNALVAVDIFKAPPDSAPEKLTELLQTFLKNTFGSKPGFSLDAPISQPDGSIEIVWGFDETIKGATARIQGNSFIWKKDDKVTLLTTGVLAEQFPRLKTSINKIINSFKLNTNVKIP
ncbi:protein kinase [Tumidithrix elongata RA019]|uniref:non-specific serine/threonine protein kinase n=1 Tax=Tumidithrix elongata BACA0141 TaxID=2716417 RepID=A0AAW9Q7B2_9CYAN|nr:protein kinase [Tumidithrix elongata RA019]